MNELRYTYKPNPFKTFAVGLLIVLGAAAIGYHASTNEKGLIINHMIHLYKDTATNFYWLIALLLGGCGVWIMFKVVKGDHSQKELILSDSYMSVPKSLLSKEIITIPYADIKNLNVQKISNSNFINIFYSQGKLSIPGNFYFKNDQFKEFMEMLVNKINAAKGHKA